jgi:hypothetical protein
MQRRPTLETPKAPEPIVLASPLPPDTLAARRSRGMLIAMLLLVLFLGIATYWVYRSAEKIVDQKKEQATPTAAPSAAPANPTAAPSSARATPVHQSSSTAAQNLP